MRKAQIVVSYFPSDFLELSWQLPWYSYCSWRHNYLCKSCNHFQCSITEVLLPWYSTPSWWVPWSSLCALQKSENRPHRYRCICSGHQIQPDWSRYPCQILWYWIQWILKWFRSACTSQLLLPTIHTGHVLLRSFGQLVHQIRLQQQAQIPCVPCHHLYMHFKYHHKVFSVWPCLQ